MSQSRPSSGVGWHGSAALLLATGLAAGCVDDGVAPGPQTAPDAGGPRVVSFVEVSFEDVGTPNMSSSVLSAPSIAALEELRAERERLRESGDDVAFEPTLAGDGTIQFGARTSNGVSTHAEWWYGHGTFDIRNADVNGVPYPDERHNLTLQAISTPNNVNGTAIRQLNLVTPGTEDEVALRVVPSGRVTVQQGQLQLVKSDVIQVVPEDYIAGIPGLPADVNVFPYGFVVRTASSTDRTLQASPAPQFHEGEVDIAYSAPLADGENIETMSITFVALDYGLDDTFVTQSFEEQTDDGADGVSQRANDLNAVATTRLPAQAAVSGGGPGRRTICSVRTAGDVGSPTGFLVNIDWSDFSQISPPDPSNITNGQSWVLTFTAAQHGVRPTNIWVTGEVHGHQFSDVPFYDGNGTPTITTPQINLPDNDIIFVSLEGDCPSRRLVGEYQLINP